jgi:hypothetical protein
VPGIGGAETADRGCPDDDATRERMLNRLDRQHERGTITDAEHQNIRHILTCSRRREIERQLQGSSDTPWIEVETRSAARCPGCGVRIERLHCDTCGVSDETVLWCPRELCCCPRCGAPILSVGPVER